jgi:hypothetical protein
MHWDSISTVQKFACMDCWGSGAARGVENTFAEIHQRKRFQAHKPADTQSDHVFVMNEMRESRGSCRYAKCGNYPRPFR